MRSTQTGRRWTRPGALAVAAAALAAAISGSSGVTATGPIATVDIPILPGQAQGWSNPNGIAIDKTGGRAFVVTYTDPSRLIAIDTTSYQIVASTVIDPTPATAIAVNPVSSRIYVPTSSQLVVFDESTLAVVATLPFTFLGPGGVVVDQATNTFYLSQMDGTVTHYDGATNAPLAAPAQIFAGCFNGFPGIDFDASTNRLFMSDYCSSAVKVVDGTTLNVLATVPTPNPQNLAISHSTNRIYVSNIEGQSVTVVDGASYSVSAVIPVGSRPSTVFVDEGTNQIYAGNTAGTTVSIISGASDNVTSTLDIGGSPAFFAKDAIGQIWVTNSTGCNPSGCLAGRVSILGVADTTAPTSSHSLGTPPNANGWNKTSVFVSITAQDNPGGSGVQSISYTLSGAQNGQFTISGSAASFTIFNQGMTTVTYHATDAAGNVESDHSFLVKYDFTPPLIDPISNITLNATSAAGAVATFSPTASDLLSGVTTIVVTPKPSGSTFPHGTTQETVTVTDAAGNIATRNFSVIVNKSLVSLAVQPSAATVNIGQSQQFQAIGTFTDGSMQTLQNGGSGGGGGGGGTTSGGSSWNVHFDDPLHVGACTGNSLTFSSQGISGSSTPPTSVDTTWGTPAIVHATGTITASQVTLTLSCISDPSKTGSLTATWTGTRYVGTATLSGVTGAVTVRGWSTKASLPFPDFSLGAASVNGVIYVMGHNNPSQPSAVEAYGTANDSWTAVSTIPTSREGGAYAAANGKIYAAGGNVAGGNPTSLVEVYDPASNTWSGFPSMTTARAHFALVEAAGRLYAIGGELTQGASGMASVESIDLNGGQWTAMAPMSTGRRFHVGGALNNGALIVVAGGNTSGASTELYDVAANTWSTGPAMAVALDGAGAAVVNNALFVVGGGPGAATVQMFRPANGQSPAGWALPGDMPTGRNQLAVAASGDVLYAVAGLHNGVPVATVEAMSTPPPTDLQVGAGGGGGGSSLPTVQWSSTNSSIAGVGGNGLATGNSGGQTTIVATANGISCQTTGTCATLTVFAPHPRCADVVLTITPVGSLPFGGLDASVEGEPGTFQIPIGRNEFQIEAGSYVLDFAPPSGYGATPNPLSFTATCSAPTTLAVTVTALDTTPPQLTLPSNMTTPATSPSGALVSFTAMAVDIVDGVRPVTCVPASGSLFPAGVTTTVTCSASDLHGNTASGTFTINVLNAAQIVAGLIGELGTFQQGLNLLQNVLKSIGNGATGDACSQLSAFINQVQAQAGKKLTQADASQLIQVALQAKGALGCP